MDKLYYIIGIATFWGICIGFVYGIILLSIYEYKLNKEYKRIYSKGIHLKKGWISYYVIALKGIEMEDERGSIIYELYTLLGAWVGGLEPKKFYTMEDHLKVMDEMSIIRKNKIKK